MTPEQLANLNLFAIAMDMKNSPAPQNACVDFFGMSVHDVGALLEELGNLRVKVMRLRYMESLEIQLAEARAELAAARSAPVAVEVPDLPFAEYQRRISSPELLTAWFRANIHPIPSDRVLKEGERAVATEYLAMLESAANRFCSSCRDSEVCTMTMRNLGGLGCGAWKLDGARINALRSGEAEGRMV